MTLLWVVLSVKKTPVNIYAAIYFTEVTFYERLHNITRNSQ